MKKWTERMKNLIFNIDDMQIPVYAANACYFLAISIFPALLLLLASLRYTPLSATDLIRLLEGILPGALMGAAESLIVSTYYNSSAGLLSISALAALWSASRGIHGLLTGLNRIYGVSEDRGWLFTRFISVLYTFVFLGVLLLTLVVHVFGGTILKLLPISHSPLLRILTGLLDFRGILLLAVQTLVFMLMFAFLPNGRNKLRDTVPGALVSSLGWLVLSGGFSVYVERFASLRNIYGSVYTIALAMLWLYFCLSILFFSAAFNQYLEDKKYK
jgi:membrane protein